MHSVTLDDFPVHFRCELSTRWSDEDNQSLLNNAVYSTLCEELRQRFFTGLGLLAENRFPFVLAACNLRFAAPGRGGVAVLGELCTRRIGQSSFEQCYRLRSGADGLLWCEAEALLVMWDPLARRSAVMDAAFRAALTRSTAAV